MGLVAFTGEVGAGVAEAFTSPLIRMILVGEFTALLVMVTDLLMGPTRLLSYFTVMMDVLPGAIGAVAQVGTVQPQLPLQLLMIKGWSPVLVTLNSQVPFAPWSIMP